MNIKEKLNKSILAYLNHKSFGDKTSLSELCQATGELPVNLKDALLYLENKGLVKLTGAIGDEHIFM